MKPKIKKRSYRKNVWGNVVGYEGGRRVEEFGCHPWSERWAQEWVKGVSKEDAEYVALGVT